MVDISIADATVEQIIANQKGLVAIGAGVSLIL